MMSKGKMNKNITAIRKLAHLGKYQDAAKIADEIRWGRVKEVKLLNMVSDIYEKCERYHDAKRVMMVIYNRVDSNKRLAYKMCELSAKAGDLADAEGFYWEFSNLAPKDPGKLILAYHIIRASKEPDEKKIEVLELYIKEDFDEKWAYKLAQLYYKTGQTEKCVRTCDEIILWYSGDRYGAAALRLKHKCLGIEEEIIQPESNSDISEQDTPEEEADTMFIENDEECTESAVNEDTIPEGVQDVEDNKTEAGPTLWFELKKYNEDVITRPADSKEVCPGVETSEDNMDEEDAIMTENSEDVFSEDVYEEISETPYTDDEELNYGELEAQKVSLGEDVHSEIFIDELEDIEEYVGTDLEDLDGDVEEASDDTGVFLEEDMENAEGIGDFELADDEAVYQQTIAEESGCEDAIEETCEEVEDAIEETCEEVENVIEEASEEVEGAFEEDASKERPGVIEETVDISGSLIVLEKCTEREKVFVFNQAVLKTTEQGVAKDDGEESTAVVKEMFAEDVIEVAGNEMIVEADIADEDGEDDVTEEIFTEEIFIETAQDDIFDVAEQTGETVDITTDNNDVVTEDEEPIKVVEDSSEAAVSIEESIEAVEETIEGFLAESEVYSDSLEADRALGGVAESGIVEENIVGEESFIEETIYNDTSKEALLAENVDECNEIIEAADENSEYDETQEVADESTGDALAEAAATTEAEEDVADSKVTLVGYIDGEHNFSSTSAGAVNEDKAETKKAAECMITEKNDEKRPKHGHNRELRVLLIECSQMRGSVKYAANKLHSIHQQEGTRLHGVARISDTKFSVRGAESALSVLKGRDLVVEGVDGITYEVVNELMNLMDEDRKPKTLALVDTPTKLALFVNRHRTFAGRCEYIYEEASISRREFLNYINNYAYKLSAVLDDMAEEELEYIADEMIEDGIAFTISDAVALVERALEKAQKPGFKGLFEAKKDSDGYLILRARHFDRG